MLLSNTDICMTVWENGTDINSHNSINRQSVLVYPCCFEIRYEFAFYSTYLLYTEVNSVAAHRGKRYAYKCANGY